ncbi:MAG TPA: NAD(P)/FAD-dependent oxidoreductase [Candidatus Limnocylindrales bacterium]|nr:NAD(P)/FAD-dependent oxidoreductase [Candidatus Limnocylindrales bacterium]
MAERLDAVVVGAGPNGLAAALTLARAGRSVEVLEAAEVVGGGARTEELTLPGFRHDVCSAVHPTAVASPFLRQVEADLAAHGLRWIQPEAPLAHPFDDRPAAVLEGSVTATADGLDATGWGGGASWRRLYGPLATRADDLAAVVLAPFRFPRHPLLMARFGLVGLPPARLTARLLGSDGARALLLGAASHAAVPLDRPPTAAFGLFLTALGQGRGWPIAAGGSGAISAALAAAVEARGGRISVGRPVASAADLPPARTVLFDLTPRQLVAIGGERLPAGYRRRLEGFRYGPGVFKLDWALAEPIPWRDPAVARAGTAHLAGSLDDLHAALDAERHGRPAERPFVILSQPSRWDPSRAPEGRHTAWAYCHVPQDSTVDMTAAMEAQVERFAPGFGDLILGRSALGPAAMEAHDANHVGGSIDGGLQDWRQLFTRPVLARVPYRLPAHGPDGAGWYCCSSSTPPGSGVHGMSGWWAAQAALRRELA